MKFKKIGVTLVILLAISLAAFSTAYAMTMLYKELSGVGNVDYNAEVTVTDIKATGPERIRVVLTSTATTEADYAYTINLFVNYTEVDTDTVTWTAPQIPGTNKIILFDNIDLSTATNISVEVVR